MVPAPMRNAANGIWWLTDVLFFVAMFAAVFSPQVKKFGEEFARWIVRTFIYEEKQILPHHERFISKRSGKVLYWSIYYVLLVVLGLNLFCNISLEHIRNPLLNLLYTIYPIVTLQSAHDVILHDDKSDWPADAKALHVLLPFSWDDKKLFVKKLSGIEVDKHYAAAMKEMKKFPEMMILAATGVVAYRFFPPALKFLCGLPFVLSSFCAYPMMNMVVDFFTLKFLSNRYEHPFGDVTAVIKKGEKHDDLGMQYEYFKRSFKPLETFLYSKCYTKAREKGASVGEAKVAYYLGRGAVVISSLLLLGLLGKDGHELTAAALVANYYVIHAAVAYFLQHYGNVVTDYSSKSNKLTGKSPFFRILAFTATELVAAPFLYMPIASRLIGQAQ